jgi:two-component system phosphate regulon sensor histidine kinase PhoR
MSILAASNLTQWLCMLAVLATLVLGGMVVRSALRLARLRRGIDQLTTGEQQVRLPRYTGGQIGQLSRALGRMADEFNQRLTSLRQQRNELEAVLASMAEGVFAVDQDEKVISLNRAAATLLQINPQRAVGRSIQEVIRNTSVQQFVSQALTVEAPTQADLVLRIEIDEHDAPGGEERYLQATGAALRDAAGHRFGALIVLHDVTRLRRLEMIRRDFVANVSHEIKTPITAIKGAVETLLDSAQTAEPDQTVGFLQIVNRQADRLNAIVEDLLALARIEQDTERDRVSVEPIRVEGVVQSAIDSCRMLAEQRGVGLVNETDAELFARANDALLEQALVNLVDNAIKYSAADTTTRVRCRRGEGEAIIEVADEGSGIESEHLPRLFERFYRTDKARSRAQGGTGLGLAIVKHIVQAHGGRITVDSGVGEGSVFRIHLRD